MYTNNCGVKIKPPAFQVLGPSITPGWFVRPGLALSCWLPYTIILLSLKFAVDSSKFKAGQVQFIDLAVSGQKIPAKGNDPSFFSVLAPGV